MLDKKIDAVYILLNMSSADKIITSVLSGTKDKNIAFADLCKLLTALGFVHRVKGDHFIYAKDGIPEIINIQPNGDKAKAYQVRQIRAIILKYHMEV